MMQKLILEEKRLEAELDSVRHTIDLCRRHCDHIHINGSSAVVYVNSSHGGNMFRCEICQEDFENNEIPDTAQFNDSNF